MHDTTSHTEQEIQPSISTGPDSRALKRAGMGAVAAALAVVAVGVGVRIHATGTLRQTAAEAAIPTVSVVVPKADADGAPLVLPGNVQAFNSAAIYARTNGYVRQWLADIGDRVRAGQVLAVLDAPEHGCLNVHASILPRWRGAAPIHRSVMAGDNVTGVTIMQMERGLDTGPMLAKVETEVDGKTAGELTTELAARGAGLMVQVLEDLPAYPPVLQPEEGVTYAHKIDKAESRLDFARKAVDVERQVRAFAPSPGAFFELEGERYRVLAADVVEASGEVGVTLDDALAIACGSGGIRPTVVQRAGRPAMDTPSLLRGRAIAAGTRLS